MRRVLSPPRFTPSGGRGGTCKRATRGGTRGFTLLELLISLALFATLMALLWSLFSTYTRLAERSRLAAVEMQLLRSLGQQLRTDVEHFARVAAPPDTASSSEPASSPEPATSSEPPTAATATPSASARESRPTFAPTSRLPNTQGPGMPQRFTSQLPSVTYLRGDARRLELVTRAPYTVDVPETPQRIGLETRYGTFRWVKYEFREAKELKTLLQEDPLLNPRRQLGQLNQIAPTNTLPNPLDPRGGIPVPQAPRRLNPNDSVGLVREAKSWLHLNRDLQREDAMRAAQAMAAQQPGASLQTPLPRRPENQPPSPPRSNRTAADLALAAWQPPPELRAIREHFPEVTRLQFRYLDRGTWQLSWTAAEGQLPQAIEVAFDIDADAPVDREDEFRDAHMRMMAGASLTDVLPPKPEPADTPETFADQLDPRQRVSLKDPTAIVTEYRVVIAIGDLLAPYADAEGEDEITVEPAAFSKKATP